MDGIDKHSVTSVEDLAALYAQPHERVLKKELDHIDALGRAFIAGSPFLVLATGGAHGLDCSPKGDKAGFVQVEDDGRTVLIPDRRGNNRLDGLKNLVEDPRVGLIFFVPGIRETLRVNGRAQITTDPALLEPTAVNGKLPRSGILITADEVYFHCGKALIRSDLWNPEKHVARKDFPSLGIVIADQIGQKVVPEEAERATEESYVARLY